MRNCFVPNCDKDSNYDKRMMFLPPKNPELFEKWRIILPKKRQFKKTDKICSRHFLKEDIVTTWDNVINGKLVQLQRDKPRLKDSAVPGLNLSSSQNEFKAVDIVDEEAVRKIRTAKAKKLASLIRSPLVRKPVRKMKREPKIMKVIQHSDTTMKNLEEFVVISSPPKRFHKVIPQSKSEPDYLTQSMEQPVFILQTMPESKFIPQSMTEPAYILNDDDFENLYDSIYEVTLPNTLWGFHRDPDKKFIAITKFDQQSMFAAKVVYIKSNFFFELHENGQIRKNGRLNVAKSEDLTDSLNELLSDFDEDKILFNENDIEK